MSYTINEVKEAIKESFSYSTTLRKMNRQVTGSSVSCLKNFIIKNNLDIRHFTFKPIKDICRIRKTPEQILNINHRRRDSYQVRGNMIKVGVEYKCNKCGLKNWLDQEIKLEINHINGNNKDNRIENLEFLCPNCHSLTPNFYHTPVYNLCECGNKKHKKHIRCENCREKFRKRERIDNRKVVRPSKEYLQKILWEIPTKQLGKQLGISDKAIEKWCKVYGIKKPPRGYWSKQNATKANLVEASD